MPSSPVKQPASTAAPRQNATLLVTLGTSPAIVPEAFLFPGANFTSVHVLTTDSTDPTFVADWFKEHAPHTTLTITRVAGFADFRSEQDHFHFEEVLYRWWLEVAPSFRLGESAKTDDPGAACHGARQPGRSPPPSSQAGSLLPHVCLSGGFKTMSAAMQKAAAVLGAEELFHVLCGLDKPPVTAAEIESAHVNDHLHWIQLGAESGLPQLKGEQAGNFPLHVEKEEGVVRWASAPDDKFRRRLREIVERSHNIAGAWDQLGELPFSTLATWPTADLAWLNEPVHPGTDQTWVHALPKIELHCHLGGFATHGPLLEEVRAAARQPERLPPFASSADTTPPTGWPRPDQPIPLESYRKLGDHNGSALLKDPGCLKKQIELLYAHLLEQNVVYAEIRCSPANYADPERDRSPWTVLTEIIETFRACVAASVPLAEKVASGVPPEGAVKSSVPDDSARKPRPGVAGSPTLPSQRLAATFHPFDSDAPYEQSWRNLPHRYQQNATAFVTFRLADSLPRQRLQEWVRERDHFLAQHPKPWDKTTWTQFQRAFPEKLEHWLDEAHGECPLSDPAHRDIVRQSLHHFDGERYILDEYVIMPNHVHVLLKPLHEHRLDDILHSWKSFTAHAMNRRLHREGKLWQHESFDHLVRSVEQLENYRRYIRENPIKAGLPGKDLTGCGQGLVVAASVPLAESVAASVPLAESVAASVPLAESVAASVPLAKPCSAPEGRHHIPAKPEARCHINLILIATRQTRGDYRTNIARHLALATAAAEHWTDPRFPRVVGVDLAGYESKETRAEIFKADFTPAHRLGLGITVHAGENDDSEGIWSALLDLNARRLGHALRLAESPTLLRTVADRGLGVEMCPYANYQIKGFAPMAGYQCLYPLKEYLEAGVRVSVNTDNIGISDASLTDNLLFLARLCPGIRRIDLLQLLANALETAFVSFDQRRTLRASIENLLPKPYPCPSVPSVVDSLSNP